MAGTTPCTSECGATWQCSNGRRDIGRGPSSFGYAVSGSTPDRAGMVSGTKTIAMGLGDIVISAFANASDLNRPGDFVGACVERYDDARKSR